MPCLARNEERRARSRPLVRELLAALAAAVALVVVVALGHPAAAAHRGDPDVEQMQREAMQALGTYDGPAERSRRITAEYWRIYQASPNLLYAKAAALASERVHLFLSTPRWLLPSADLRQLQSVVADGNIAIYRDVAWTLRAYSDGRIKDVASRLPELQRQAFTLIEAGKLEEGNLLFVQREQRDILQPIIGQHAEVWERQAKAELLPPNFNGLFNAVALLTGNPPFPSGRSFADLEVRLGWAREGFDWAVKHDERADEAIRAMEDKTRRQPPPFLPPGGGGGAVPVFTAPALVRGTIPAPGTGGVDFSAVELRYLAERSDAGRAAVAYAFRADDPASGLAGGPDVAGVGAVRDAFLTWLALPPDTFWVNLRPDEPDRVIDAELGRTTAGRIMLEADLQLKKTVATLIHPDSPTGAAFWDTLDAAGTGSELCLSFRQWIVPGPVRVWADDEALYILDAPLEVKLESDYRGQAAQQCPKSGASDQAEQLFRSTILPGVAEAVNHASEYGPLRTIFSARVAGEWYRTTHRQLAQTFASTIDRGRAEGWYATDGWTPRKVFDAYVTSTKEGEFKLERRTIEGNVISVRTYFYGGVDFMRLAPTVVTDAELSSVRPHATSELHRAIFGLDEVQASGGGSLAGGAYTTGEDDDSDGHSATPEPEPTAETVAAADRPGVSVRLVLLTVAAVVAVVLGLAAFLWWRRQSEDDM